jgi:hypothetical protein
MGLVVYELAGKLSRAFSSSALAAFAIAVDVPARVVKLGEPGFNGSGGGARSGSELSHLVNSVSGIVRRNGECWRSAREERTLELLSVSHQPRKSVSAAPAPGPGTHPCRRRALCVRYGCFQTKRVVFGMSSGMTAEWRCSLVVLKVRSDGMLRSSAGVYNSFVAWSRNGCKDAVRLDGRRSRLLINIHARAA